MTRLIFTSFSALLLSALLAPVATARTHTTTQTEAGLPTMRALNQYNPQDHERGWQPNNAHTNPGQANTIQINTTAVDTEQMVVGQAETQPGVQVNPQPETQPVTPQPGSQPGMQQPQVPQPGTQLETPETQPGAAQFDETWQQTRSLPTMRVLNQYNPRDHERNWQPNSPSHDIVSDRRTMEESQSSRAQMLDARDTDTGVF